MKKSGSLTYRQGTYFFLFLYRSEITWNWRPMLFQNLKIQRWPHFFNASCILRNKQKSAQPAVWSKTALRLLFVVCSHSVQQTGSGSAELEHNIPPPRLQHLLATCKMFSLIAPGRWVCLGLPQLFYGSCTVPLWVFFHWGFTCFVLQRDWYPGVASQELCPVHH